MSSNNLDPSGPPRKNISLPTSQNQTPDPFAAALARKLSLASNPNGITQDNPLGNNVTLSEASPFIGPPSGLNYTPPNSHVYMTPTSDPAAFDQTLRSMGIGYGAPDPVDPFTKLTQDLLAQVQGINSQFTPDDVLRSQAQSQVSAQYDPLIQQLQGQMDRTTNRAHENQDKARSMYNSLGDSFMNSIGDINSQNQQAQNDASNRYDSAVARMQQQYADQASQQQAIMNRLGIQAAQGDPRLQQAATDQNYFQNTMQMDKQHQLDMLQGQNQADQGYQRGIASSSKLAGENTAQDIGRQLEDYLGQSNDKLTGLRTQEVSDLTNLFNQLKGQDQQRVSSANSAAFNQLMALNNFQLDALKAQNQSTNDQNNLALKLQELQQKMNGNMLGQNSGMSGAANLLAQRYGTDTNTATLLQNILAQTLSSPDVVSGKQLIQDPATGADTTVPMTPEYVMQKLRELAAQNNVKNGGDINNLIDAYLAYNGSFK